MSNPVSPDEDDCTVASVRVEDTVAGDVTEEFWLRHLNAGLELYAVATVLAFMYLYLTPGGANRRIEWLLVGVSAAATLAVVALPRRTIVKSSNRMVFFAVWSVFTCLFVAAITALDGGLGSPLAVLFFILTTYASLAYAAPGVLGVGALTAALAAAVAWSAGDTLTAAGPFIGAIGMVTLLSASATRARSKQRVARHDLTLRLVELATHDGLTGCLTRRAFYDRVELELARSVRSGSAVCLLVLDVDKFKAVNDTCGHVVGDEALRCLGAAINDSVRGSEAVGRIGGDEFAVLLLDVTREEAEAAAVRFCTAVSDMASPVRITVTVGVAHVEHPTLATTSEVIMATADAHLYELKRRRTADRAVVPGWRRSA
jgi:diguanylate cyclase (GGDEF)-like protein